MRGGMPFEELAERGQKRRNIAHSAAGTAGSKASDDVG